jgi:LysM repeat protein
VLFFPRSSGNEFSERINALEQRLAQIEGKLAQDERMNERLAKVEEEAKELNTFMFQLRRSEKSLNDRINRLSKRVAARKPTPKAAPSKTKAAKTTSAAAKPAQYHTVKKGDTLFGIARKYELSVNELQRFNKLKANAVLFPGQRLLVKPAN